MAGGGAILDFGGTIMDRPAVAEEQCAALLDPAALELAAQQVSAPATVVGALQLGVDEAIDGLVADDSAAVLACEAAGDLLGRPTVGEMVEDLLAQCLVAFEARAGPAPRRRLLLGIARSIADL